MKYKCCNRILHGFVVFDWAIMSCCDAPNDQQFENAFPPIIYPHYKGEIIPVEDFFNRMHHYAELFKAGTPPASCNNCCYIEEKDWNEEKFINYITISHFSKCNADCIYCSNNLSREERTNEIFSILPFIKYLDENNCLSEDLEVHIGGGEFTIYKECEEILEFFLKKKNVQIYIPTNSIKYSDSIFNLLNQGRGAIIVSIDAGTSDTYKRIKRADAFDKVVNNLKMYAKTEISSNRIQLKYIIVPFYNDNMKEFMSFVSIAKEIGAHNISIDIDARYAKIRDFKLDEYIMDLALNMKSYADKEGFKTEYYSFMQQCLAKSSKSKNKLMSVLNKRKFRKYREEIEQLYASSLYGKRTPAG